MALAFERLNILFRHSKDFNAFFALLPPTADLDNEHYCMMYVLKFASYQTSDACVGG